MHFYCYLMSYVLLKIKANVNWFVELLNPIALYDETSLIIFYDKSFYVSVRPFVQFLYFMSLQIKTKAKSLIQ